MSTRSQVIVYGEEGWQEGNTIFIYHHWDGYPSNMLKLIKQAFDKSLADGAKRGLGEGATGNMGKIVSYVVSVDPEGYEVESERQIHGDIEWLYTITGKDKNWLVTVMIPTDRRALWDSSDEDALAMFKPVSRVLASDITEKMGEKLEKKAR